MEEINVPNLSVEFCGLHFSNPLLLASGGLGETADTLFPFLKAEAAAVVTRTIRLHVDPNRKVFPCPHLMIDHQYQYMLNCEWGNLISWNYWLQEGIPQLREHGLVIVSLSGRNIEDCVTLAQKFDQIGVPLFEINVSCTHSGLLYGRLNDDATHVSRLVTELKRRVKAPIMIKLGWSPILSDIAKITVQAGADAIATTNSIGPVLDVRLKDGRPELGIQGGIGGLSGKAIFPIALQCVHSVVETVDVPVMGIGGVSSYREVIKMLMVGAHCVQIYTAAFLSGPQLFPSILQDLTTYMQNHGYPSLQEIRGMSLPFLHQSSNLVPIIPVLQKEKCTACGVCANVCLSKAITIEQTAVINAQVCTGCGACVHVCPPEYRALYWP